VDNSTEEWLDTIEDKREYEAWYLGHWHTDKRIAKMYFLFHGVEVLYDTIDELKKEYLGIDCD
jgi:3-oxoacid CoA-transferase subunit A